MLEPVERALADERRAVRALRLELLGEQREHWVVGQLRKRRINQSIALKSGTAGSEADTSGTCWRKRATFDFTENLEELTGIWVRYEIDPDGGTHPRASPPESVEWAWQGAE